MQNLLVFFNKQIIKKWYKQLPKNVTIYDSLEELKKSNSKAHLIISDESY